MLRLWTLLYSINLPGDNRNICNYTVICITYTTKLEICREGFLRKSFWDQYGFDGSLENILSDG